MQLTIGHLKMKEITTMNNAASLKFFAVCSTALYLQICCSNATKPGLSIMLKIKAAYSVTMNIFRKFLFSF